MLFPGQRFFLFSKETISSLHHFPPTSFPSLTKPSIPCGLFDLLILRKEQKSDWNIPNHHHPPSCSPPHLPPPNPQSYLHPCPAFAIATVREGSPTCVLVSSPSGHLGHLDSLVTSVSPVSSSLPSVVLLLYQHVNSLVSYNTLSFKPTSSCPVLSCSNPFLLTLPHHRLIC